MSETITISLEEQEGIEDYARTDRNIVQARVRVGADGEWHSSPGCIVDLSLSREAMIGLATAPLRAAHQHPDSVNFVEMLPSEAGHAVERFGVFMHPKSCRLHLRQQDFGELDALLL
jgi:hypothetical protein